MAAKRRLRRSQNKVFAGVCAGLAERARVNPGLVRLMYAFGTAVSFVLPGLTIYVVCYLLMAPPEKQESGTS
jgi:phage shock protein C